MPIYPNKAKQTGNGSRLSNAPGHVSELNLPAEDLRKYVLLIVAVAVVVVTCAAVVLSSQTLRSQTAERLGRARLSDSRRGTSRAKKRAWTNSSARKSASSLGRLDKSGTPHGHAPNATRALLTNSSARNSAALIGSLNKLGTPRAIQLPWYCLQPAASGIRRKRLSCMRANESYLMIALHRTYGAPLLRGAHAAGEAKPRALYALQDSSHQKRPRPGPGAKSGIST